MESIEALSLEALAERIGTAIARVGEALRATTDDDDGEQVARRFYCRLDPRERAEFVERLTSDRWRTEAVACVEAIVRLETSPGVPAAREPTAEARDGRASARRSAPNREPREVLRGLKAQLGPASGRP
jgi:hypothetical protein